MQYTVRNLTLAILLLITISRSANGYPIINTEENLSNNDEKRYPNGTVIGKYTYTDNEGNPIHVKYYANDASYGVELKSVKVVNSNLSPMVMEKLPKYALQVTELPFDYALDNFTGFKDALNINKNLTSDMDHAQAFKDKNKVDLKNNVEFEILLQNELKAPEKCGKEKIKVYFDKDKRKTRNAPNNYNLMSYCNRF